MAHISLLPPLASESLAFDIARETRRTLVDLIRGSEPTTIMGVLLNERTGVTIESLAEALNKPPELISWNVEKLESEDLCVRAVIGGVSKVLPIAAYSERNE
jgi:hypothetical protein